METSMEKWNGKVAVVTGASAGIGAAITEQLVEAGVKVVGLARRKAKLEELGKKLEGKNGKFYAFEADVIKEEDIIKAFEWTRNNIGAVHILINNAGILSLSTLIDGDAKLWKDVLDTNVLGWCIATREAVKDMRINNVSGHIVHINSVAGHIVPNIPDMNVYPASKHIVTALTETLRQELNSIGSKIKTSSVSPGFVATEILKTSAKANRISQGWKSILQENSFLKAKDVADAVLYVLSTPPHVQVEELTIASLF